MKAKIHPKYYHNCLVTCACGNSFTTGSTLPEIKVDICSACHPFFTGEMKFVDTQGRVEKFRQKIKATSGKKYISKKKRQQAKLDRSKNSPPPMTLKEMLTVKKSKPKASQPPSSQKSQKQKK